jgi:hypothetical protein
MPKVAHYHGDEIRILFVATTILSFVVIPVWGNLLPFGLLFQLGTGIALICLAGLTNPHSATVMIVDTVVAGAGVFFLEAAAITLYHADPFMLFLVREFAGIMLLLALYYGVRTLRAMMQRKLGKTPELKEFEPKSKATK